MLNNSMSDELLKQTKQLAFEQGIKYALTQLQEVYGEGLELTDLWNEYMIKETN